MKDVVAVNFGQESKACEAMSVMNELDGEGQLELGGTAVVVRTTTGGLRKDAQRAAQDAHEQADDPASRRSLKPVSPTSALIIGGATGLLMLAQRR